MIYLKKNFNLKKKIDDNNEIKKVEFRNLKNITFSDNPFQCLVLMYL